MVLVALDSPNENACRDILGEIRRGEWFSFGELCCVVGRRKKSDIGPPRMAGALGRRRAGIPAMRS
jgi:hypothetical protein